MNATDSDRPTEDRPPGPSSAPSGPLRRKPWFWGLVGATLYLIGVNDAALDWFGGFWLDLPKWLQTTLVVVLLLLAAYFVGGWLRRRRSAYGSAVRAAEHHEPTTTVAETHTRTATT